MLSVDGKRVCGQRFCQRDGFSRGAAAAARRVPVRGERGPIRPPRAERRARPLRVKRVSSPEGRVRRGRQRRFLCRCKCLAAEERGVAAAERGEPRRSPGRGGPALREAGRPLGAPARGEEGGKSLVGPERRRRGGGGRGRGRRVSLKMGRGRE